jgi:predicted dehydrogenase
MEAAHAGLPAYVEKPLMTDRDYRELAAEALLPTLPLYERHVCGFQYLFHPQMPAVHSLALRHREIAFRGNDDLLERYGPNVGEIMVAHPIASALRFFGPAGAVELRSNGIALQGTIIHRGGGASHYAFAMDRGPRESWAGAYGTSIALTADPGMYLDCLRAWLDWLDGGPRDPRLSSLAEGLEVSRVLAAVARVEAML